MNKVVSWVFVSLLLSVAGSSVASAQETQPTRNSTEGLEEVVEGLEVGEVEEVAEEEEAAPPLIAGPVGSALTFVSDSPALIGGVGFDGGLFLGAGFSLDFNPNVANDGEESASVHTSLILYGFYAVHNEAPVALGPELLLHANLTPGDVLSPFVIQPGFAFYVAPFDAPVLIGSALSLQIVTQRGEDPAIKTLSPALRFGWVFN